MLQLGNEDKVIAYRTILELESRSQEFEGLVERLKDQMLNQPTIIPPEVIATIDDLTWHLRQSARLVPALEKTVGIERSHKRAKKPARPSTPNEQGLRGTTKSICVADLLGLLGQQSKTGTLWIKTMDELFVMEFCEGAVVHASTNKPVAEHRLGTILVAQNKVSEERLEAELARANSDGPIGETILRAELVSEADLRDALEHQVQELFHRVNQIADARFAFRDGEVSELEKRVCLSTTQLLLESARHQDEKLQDPHSYGMCEPGDLDGKNTATAETDEAAGNPMTDYGLLTPGAHESTEATTESDDGTETTEPTEAETDVVAEDESAEPGPGTHDDATSDDDTGADAEGAEMTMTTSSDTNLEEASITTDEAQTETDTETTGEDPAAEHGSEDGDAAEGGPVVESTDRDV